MSINILIIDGHALFRQGISSLIHSEADLRVVGEGSSVADGEALLRSQRVDVLVVDVSLPDGSGLNLARATRDRSPSMGIVVLAMHNDDDTLLSTLEAGASALVLKGASPDEIVNAVRRAASVPAAFSANGLAAAMHRRQAAVAARTHLSAQEDEVLQHLVAGESITQVAHELSLRESTVKALIGSAYDKLGNCHRATTVRPARRLGVVSPYATSSMRPIRVPGHSHTPGPR